jgi:hypothetical protein
LRVGVGDGGYLLFELSHPVVGFTHSLKNSALMSEPLNLRENNVNGKNQSIG